MVTLSSPPNLQWELTAECNHDCVHCYNYWRKDPEKIANQSTPKTADEYLEMAMRVAKLRPVSVILTGGEPLLVFKRIVPIIDFLKRSGIVVSINTNATLLTDEICDFLRQRDIHLFVSFPCANPEVCDLIVNRKDALAKIIKGLDLAMAHKVNFSNNIVVSTKNLDYVEMTVDFLVNRYHPKSISVTRVSKPINSDDSFNDWVLYKDGTHKLLDIVVALSKKYPHLTIGTACPYTPCSINSQEAFDLYGYQKLCTAGKTSFAIDADGNFKACPRDSRLYGNIFEQDFTTVYENMREWQDGSFIPKKCKECQELSKCFGGCRADAIALTGRSDELDCISDPENLPLKYTVKSKGPNIGDKVFTYDVRDTIRVTEKGFIRLSHGRNYVMITNELYDFLIKYGEGGFTSEALAKSFNKSTDITDAVIVRLLRERIIYPK